MAFLESFAAGLRNGAIRSERAATAATDPADRASSLGTARFVKALADILDPARPAEPPLWTGSPDIDRARASRAAAAARRATTLAEACPGADAPQQCILKYGHGTVQHTDHGHLTLDEYTADVQYLADTAPKARP